ncbi:hypothetical protein D3C76_820120 [compost metagenome]
MPPVVVDTVILRSAGRALSTASGKIMSYAVGLPGSEGNGGLSLLAPVLSMTLVSDGIFSSDFCSGLSCSARARLLVMKASMSSQVKTSRCSRSWAWPCDAA